MQLPFTVEEFFGVFRDYNVGLWPAQIGLVALALCAVAFVFRRGAWSGIAVSAILAFLWVWLALAYHLAYFARINPLAYVFAGASLAGAVIFLWQGVVHRRLRFAWRGGCRAWTGAALVLFALLAYPAWSWLAGHRYPSTPTFGLPCPTTIFTVGLLAFLVPPYPRSAFAVPVLWCFTGVQAALLLGVPQDLGLAVAGVSGVILMVRSGRAAAAKTV